MIQGKQFSGVISHCGGELKAFVEDTSIASWSNSTSRSTSPSVTESSAPRKVRFCAEEADDDEEEHIIVKGTFLDLDNGSSLADRYKLIRKSKTDSNLYDKLDPEVYEPGKYSDDVQSRLDETMPCNQVRQELTEQAWQLARQQIVAVLPVQPQQALIFLQPVPGHTDRRTTVMMRNIPNNYTRDMFLAMLDGEGFQGLYDFVYLPCDFNRDANLGYAFVNLVSADATKAFWTTFAGFSRWVLPTAKVCQVGWSGPHQGLTAHVERYRNSPVMHQSVRDDYKPVIFSNGVRQSFPSPTKKIKAPGKTISSR
eukprot:TRINITY_DN59868_c0_g1_i1.p1 TRINITY_DN59868_c0_g1~~TRINITY_DN59868_c0_g1_i1.p1  ORF type:complete len:311 (-),score=57.41 TRINITY_DN59868_c0_g1_i1:293-1225(-)